MTKRKKRTSTPSTPSTPIYWPEFDIAELTMWTDQQMNELAEAHAAWQAEWLASLQSQEEATEAMLDNLAKLKWPLWGDVGEVGAIHNKP